MQVYYPPLPPAPPNVDKLMREIVNGLPTMPIPASWEGIMIYHPATNHYYSTKSKDPLKYENIVRNKVKPAWDSLAIALRKLLERDSTIQFFVVPIVGRATVEDWMTSIGKRRVTTRMGEAANVLHVMFQITSNENRFTRYVVAPAHTPQEELITSANKGMATWLGGKSPAHKHEREVMRIALRSRFQVNTKVFESSSTVLSTNHLAGLTHKDFRKITTDKNLEAIRQFISNTVSGS